MQRGMDGGSDMKMLFALTLATLLGGCGSTVAPVETRWKTVTVTKRGPCPDKASYAKLKASRPVPLRAQARPRSGPEKVARTAAQLGLYEAEGKWADQVQAVLDRCQVEGSESETAEGVASDP